MSVVHRSASLDTMRCDVCGSSESRFILTSARLDGPLVRCRVCGLHYVGGRRHDLVFGNEPPAATVARIRAANVAFAELPRDEERRLNRLNADWRLAWIRRFQPAGRLLEVGCARGDFLRAARASFEVWGVEPNPDLAADARLDAPVHGGLLDQAPWSDFDVIASFHVIEHVDSPSRLVREMVRRLKPGGLLALETPNIGALPYRVWRARWRQFIPEHYYFFDPRTVTRLLEDQGLAVQRIVRIGKYASIGFLLNRLGRHLPARRGRPRATMPLGTMTFRVNPLDIMLVLATV